MMRRIMDKYGLPNMTSRVWAFILCCVVPVLEVSASQQNTHLLERLVRSPLVAAPSLSSDGHFLSGLVRNASGKSPVTVWSVNAGFETKETLPYERGDLNWMAWVGGGRLLLSLEDQGLVIYDAHIRRLRPLIDEGGPKPDELPPVLLSDLPDDPAQVLLQWEDPGTPGFPAVYRVNIVEGVSEKIVSAWRPVIRWWASPSGEVRLGEGYKKRDQFLYAREARDGSWYSISRRDFFTGPAHSILSVEAGGATALVLAVHKGSRRDLWRMDIQSGDMLRKLAGHKLYDMHAALIDPVTDLAAGVTYYADKPVNIYWQEARQQEIKQFSERLKGKQVSLVTASRDGRRLLLRSLALHRPAVYYLYDRPSDTLHMLPTDPDLGTLPKPQVEGVFIPVKGTKQPMHAVLSHPEHGPTGKAVVLVHGGPVNRSVARFQPYVSWMTANGFSVLQPNFRGSSGYGEKWRRAGYAEWGRVMQNDVRTAGQWLMENGVSTPERTCVAGGSYGGFAALLSSVRDDDLFVCAISLNGVTSLPHLVSYLQENRFHALSVPRIAGKLSLRTMQRRSPLYRAEQINMPVLLLHATHDLNVPFYHSTLMVEALVDAGKPYEYIVLKDAEHVLYNAADKYTYLESSLAFMEKYIRSPSGK